MNLKLQSNQSKVIFNQSLKKFLFFVSNNSSEISSNIKDVVKEFREIQNFTENIKEK